MTTAKLPKPGTRRRALYDLLTAHAGKWVEFDPTRLGYSGAHQCVSDLRDFRETYEMEIHCSGVGLNNCRWRYLP